MMTKVTQLERTEEKAGRKQAHFGRLLEALGDGRQWEYTGVCNDLGKPAGRCACGHQIRFEFVVARKDGEGTVVLGSECINYFQDVNPETFAAMQEAYEQIRAKLAEAKRAARAAQQADEVEAARKEWQACKERAQAILDAALEDNRWLPYELFRLRRTAYLGEPPEYQRAGDLKRWYIRAAKNIQDVLSALPPMETWQRRRKWW